MTDEQPKVSDWLQSEIKQSQTPTQEFEHLEALKLESGKIVTFTVDFSVPFKKWTDDKNTTKAIIPVTHKDVKKNLWLNVKNPLYSQICKAGLAGQTVFRVSTTGTQKDTRYEIVVED